ncbi:hypothetical protein H2204_009306 [Knufia peltigerae]|uniref:Uncharacterized protein n=1 Tax=Knufia peltigerae TaxID=1002370 RepID=A0AA38XY67_9EURO|nr:hypothetical protein H2204_009306 [Knufia peltigerae]
MRRGGGGGNERHSQTHPDDLLVTIIDFLMFPVSRDEGPISRVEVLSEVSLDVIRRGDHGPVTTDRVNYGVLITVVMNRRRRMRVRPHQRTTDRRGQVDYGGLMNHEQNVSVSDDRNKN